MGQPGPNADEVGAALARVTRVLPGGAEERPGQLAMASAVAEAIERGHHLVVQAGTGTGKSFAYLVPAVLSGHKVVVATATKALQDQLAKKDLPVLEQALGRTFRFAVLKGRANYLCRQRVAEIGGASGGGSAPGQLSLAEEEAVPRGLADQVRRLVQWADRTDSGDRAELPFEPHPRAWQMVSVGPRECPGKFNCPSGTACFAESARQLAADADVVVVNTHLYGSHVASGGVVLPEHDVVVFDEAHEVEEVMTACLGVDLTPGRLHALVAMARPLLHGPGGPGGPGDPVAERALDALSDAAERLQRVLAPLEGRRVLVPGQGGELADLVVLAGARCRAVLSLLQDADAERPADATRRARALSAGGNLAEDLARLAHPSDGEVAFVESGTLRLAPIDVAPPLAGQLWNQVAAVLTSATIPQQLTARLGLGQRGGGDDPAPATPVTQLDVGSPFDYPTHALLYVPADLPDRKSPDAEAAIVDELEALITAAGGRTLALFTSRRAVERAAAELAGRLRVPVLVQDDLPKARLLRRFAEEETSCLFATMGMWQGVDVPGRSLSLVTLDRLPFPRPDDPLLQARRDRAGAGAFRAVDLPRAATLLAQGAGRLIRGADDYGVVAVLDPRLATAGYRKVLLAALPPMRRTRDRRQVVDFLGRATSVP